MTSAPSIAQPIDVAPPHAPTPVLTPAPLRGWKEQFRAEHVGLLLTLAYLFLAGVGMLHEALVFAAFHINIIAFAEPSDFVLAAIRDPLVVLVNLAALPIVGAYYRWMQRTARANAGRQRWWMGSPRWRALVHRNFSTLFVFTVVLYAFTFSLWYAVRSATRLRAGNGQRVRVELIADPGHLSSDTTGRLLLGTTQKFVFLYDPAARVTSVVPSSNIARLIVDGRPARRANGRN